MTFNLKNCELIIIIMTGLPGVSGGGRSSVDGVGVNVNNRNEVNI